MPESWSRRIFLFEVVLLVAPLSLIYVFFGVVLFIIPGLDNSPWPFRVNALIGVLVLAAVLAAWVLILSYLRAGSHGLRERGLRWWLLPFVGVTVVLSAGLTTLLPPSIEYSNWWSFRTQFEMFVLGAPLLVPLAHLFAERTRRVGV